MSLEGENEEEGISSYLDSQPDQLSRRMASDGRPVPGDSLRWSSVSNTSLDRDLAAEMFSPATSLNNPTGTTTSPPQQLTCLGPTATYLTSSAVGYLAQISADSVLPNPSALSLADQPAIATLTAASYSSSLAPSAVGGESSGVAPTSGALTFTPAGADVQADDPETGSPTATPGSSRLTIQTSSALNASNSSSGSCGQVSSSSSLGLGSFHSRTSSANSSSRSSYSKSPKNQEKRHSPEVDRKGSNPEEGGAGPSGAPSYLGLDDIPQSALHKSQSEGSSLLGVKRSVSQTSNKSPGVVSYPSTGSINQSLEKIKTTKRKSWINNALNPTYASRSEELKKYFPGLPNDEMLVVDYSCALQKDILVHGRLYITNNNLCFYANIFKWETAVSIRWKEVTAMTKEKTALVIPNAIQICTSSEKLFFCSFATRDKAHMMMFRVWQNALMDSPATQSELWSWVVSVYGAQQYLSARTSDDNEEECEDIKPSGSRSSYLSDSVGDKPSLQQQNKSVESLPTDQSDNTESEGIGFTPPHSKSSQSGNRGRQSSEHAGGREGKRKHGSSVQGGSSCHQLSSVVPRATTAVLAATVGAGGGAESGGQSSTNPTRPGIVSTDILTYEVWRQSKDAKEVFNRNVTINCDDLFTLLFTNSKFFYDFQAERKTFDIVQCPWQQSETSEDKFRQVCFTLNLNHAMGPKTSRAVEVQTMKSNSSPGHIYNVDVETTNPDVPYGDTFSVLSHYCVVKVNDNESRLTVLCDIKYKKSPWGLVKTFIEKNVWAGIEEHYLALSAALDREIEMRKETTMKEQAGSCVPKKKTRRQRNQRRMSSSEQTMSSTSPPRVQPSIAISHPTASGRSIDISERPKDYTVWIFLALLGLLFLINLFLLYKIWCLENQLTLKMDALPSDPDFLVTDSDNPPAPENWLNLLRTQEQKHRKDLINWRAAVKSAAKLLKETENSMQLFTKSLQAQTERRFMTDFMWGSKPDNGPRDEGGGGSASTSHAEEL